MYYKQAGEQTLTLRTFFLNLYGALDGVLKTKSTCPPMSRGEAAIFTPLTSEIDPVMFFLVGSGPGQ
jgi:hypothetical protein